MREPRIPEYGVGADEPSMRRGRWAFRCGVAAFVLFTFSLWMGERFLRFNLNETQYLMSLTLLPDSARPVLRNVVKRELEGEGKPDARYIEALASVEEPGLFLEFYQQAYELDPDNWSLALNYGTRLWLEGKYEESRERFREAAVHAPDNALPRYLEAAALAQANPEQTDLSEVMALIQRANVSGHPVRFPVPLWHSSLPRKGAWYQSKQREIVDRCCAPLYRLNTFVIASAKASQGKGQRWDDWFKIMEQMGDVLVGTVESPSRSFGISQALAGLRVQLDSLELREWLRTQAGRTVPAEWGERRGRLEAAFQRLSEFESARAPIINAHRGVVLAPIALGISSILIMLVAWALVIIVERAFSRGVRGRNAAHPRASTVLFLGWFTLLAAILMALIYLQADYTAGQETALLLALGWYVLLFGALMLTPLYPFLVLPGVSKKISELQIQPDDDDNVRMVRRARRDAALSLARRYVGVLFGLMMIALCVWFTVARISTGLQPTQLELLSTGLAERESLLVAEIIRQLGES